MTRDAIIGALIGAVLTFLGVWFWRHRDRIVKQEDAANNDSRAERADLARTIETDRRDRAGHLEDEQKDFVIRINLLDKTLTGEIAHLREQLASLETQVSPLWAAVQAKIIRDLTHPSPQFQEMDELMRRLAALKITEAERVRLSSLLEERIISNDPEVSDDEKESARLMKVIMEKVA